MTPALVGQFARDGGTVESIAAALGIDRSTLLRWAQRYPDIRAALKAGRAVVDAHVESALYRSACGYDLETIEHHDDGAGKIRTVKKIVHYPPHPTSIIFWLKNRRRDKWRDKHDVDVDVTAKVDIRAQESALARKIMDDPELHEEALRFIEKINSTERPATPGESTEP